MSAKAPAQPAAGVRRDGPTRRDTTVRGPWAAEVPEARGAEPAAAGSQLFSALLHKARSQGQGGGGQQERGRSTAAPRRAGPSRRAMADAAAAMLGARCQADIGDGQFELHLPGGATLRVQHRHTQGSLRLSLASDDADLCGLLRRDITAIATRLSLLAGQPVLLGFA